MSKGLLLSAPANEIPTKNRTKARGRASVFRAGQPAFLYFIRLGADSLAPGDIGVAQGRMDKIRIQEYTLFGLDEVQRWSEIPPYRESNAADEREKLVAKLLDEIE